MCRERHVKLFKSGRSQAVRILREFELQGEDATMRKEGSRIIIEPAPTQSLVGLLSELTRIADDFGPINDTAPDPVGF